MPMTIPPLSVDQYANWGAANLDAEAALKKDSFGLESAAKQVGSLARFFNTQSAKDVRSAVMADFTRALSSRFGASLAQEALADAGLTPTSKLTGKTIKAVIDYARQVHKAEVDSLMTQDLRLATSTITLNEIKTYGEENVGAYLGVRRLAIDALGETPLDSLSLDDLCDRINSIDEKLARITNRCVVAPPPGTPFAKIYADAQALRRALSDKYDEMKAMLDDQPLSEENKQGFKAVWAEGALRALNSLKPVCSPALRTAIDSVMQSVRDDPKAFLDSIPLQKDAQDPLAKSLFARLKAQVPSKDLTFKEDFLAKLIFAGYRQTLNCGEWPAISKNLTVAVGNVPVSLTSKIVPGRHIGAPSADGTGPIGATYDPGVNGYMCHCADTKHAVNLAVSSLTVPDANGTPKEAFHGVRHGVHCAWEIEDDAKRAQANVQRAEEAVIAAFLADPKNADRARRGELQYMVSVSLLTPDVARHLKGSKGSDERQMLREQKAAWDAVTRKGVTFTHNGETFHIRPKVITCNFGVNSGAVNFGSVAPDLAGGWSMSENMNLVAYLEMKPLVDAFVSDPNVPADAKKAVSTLFRQCEDVMRARGERSDGHDAYKVAARLAVVTHLMGWTPCWNCKSGKDRTGQMDVECKFLATLVARGEPIPEPGMKLTKEQTELFRAIALEGGNFEMQQANTGVGGYKTNGVGSIAERMGGDIFRNFHKGGSSFVNV